MKTTIRTLLALAVLALSACATATFTTGRDFDISKVSQIAKGKTTPADLLKWIGAPYQKNIDGDGTERWTWVYAEGKSHAQSYIVSTNVKTEMTGKRLSVTIRNGIVQDFSFTDGPMSPASLAGMP